VILEKAINQEKFESETQKAVINIHYTSSWLSQMQNELFRQFDLTIQQFNILRILRGQHPNSCTVNMLIDRMIDKSSNASRIVEKLREKELVERKTCPDDRRRVDIIITKKGLDLLSKANNELLILQNEINHLKIDEAKELNRLLDKMRTPKNKKQ
jgi:DNA-binding MarR family transcriptional regulator